MSQTLTTRVADHPVDGLFLHRWSPRAFDGEPLAPANLATLLEAARWAPSAFNLQPWRFLYAHRGDAWWDRFLEGLNPFNRDWAHRASALIYLLSDRLMPGRDGELVPSEMHSFDAGAAWMQLALQASMLGLQTHAMAGLDEPQARRVLKIPGRYRIEIAIAVGRRGPVEALPAALRDREAPSRRHPLDSIAWSGSFDRSGPGSAP